jgi:exodeoxyribonuclease-3
LPLKLATWNVNSLRIRIPHLEKWAKKAKPDLVCLQETKTEDAEFPVAEIEALGFPHLAFIGEKSYNGVALLSRTPLEGVIAGFGDGVDDPHPRMISAMVAGIRVVCCYVPNGQQLGSPAFAYKLAWFDRLRAFLGRIATPDDPVAVVGDMNVAPEEQDVWDPFQCDGQVLFHPLERQKIQDLLGWGLTDAFRTRQPFASQFSWWDYRGMGFQRNHGLRIDHVFVTKPLLARCTSVVIEREVRTWKDPSDHVPVVATFRE